MPHVLLVEDDDQVRMLLKTNLISAGYEVSEAPNGAGAGAMYKQRRPDLVVTDVLMPDKDGLELIMELRRTDPSVRILAISGGGKTDSESHLKIAQKLGAKQTLAKPFGNDAFLEAVRLALEESSKEQSNE